MKKEERWVPVLALLFVVGAGMYVWWQQQAPPAPEPVAVPPVAQVQTPAPAPAAEAPPAIAHPVEAAPTAAPLPALEESDALLGQRLAQLFGARTWKALFLPETLVRRIVATVDNLPRQEAPAKMWPVRPAEGWMAVSGKDATLAVAPENARRYAAHAALLKTADMAALVALYREFYPLFQQAYVELGFPQGYFNDRLIAALDDLLATPEPAGPLLLVQEKVRYRFADPDLDRRSAGQKILLRSGVENTRLAKTKLAELRRLLAKPVP